MTTNGAENEHMAIPGRPHGRLSLDEQARVKGTLPIGDGSFYAREELFDQPGELEEFLDFVQESRRTGVA